MKLIELIYQKTAKIPQSVIKKNGQTLTPEITRIAKAQTQGYTTDYASINSSTDTQSLEHIKAVIQEKKALNPKILIVIGIGGSNLGTKAIHQALYGNFYNEMEPLKVYWADTVDAATMVTLLNIMNAALSKGDNILLNVVSKSGTTTETVANFFVLLSALKQKKDDYFNYIVATTDKNSALWTIAQQEHITTLEIPKKIGGRYSVFTAVGLFPLGMVHVNVDELLQGARSIIPECTDPTIVDNPAALSAVILAYHYHKGISIHDTFLFSSALEGIGYWYRQLMAESIGKEFDRKAQNISVAFTPTVSMGSTDLHSLGQLYLDGNMQRVTTFITLEKEAEDITVPYLPDYTKLDTTIQGKSFNEIMHAIITGVQRAYLKRKLPFMTLKIPEKTPYYIGQLLQCKMLEIMYLGYLLNVNPFDQPNVELYKQETRKILDQ